MNKRGIFALLIFGVLTIMICAEIAAAVECPTSSIDAYRACIKVAAASSAPATAAPVAKAPAAPATAATLFRTQCIDYRTVPPSIETPADSQEIARLSSEGYECLEIQVEASATEESTPQLAGAELWWMTLNFPEISQDDMERSVGISQPLNKFSITKEIACIRSSASEVRCIGEINPFNVERGNCAVPITFELSFSEKRGGFLWLSKVVKSTISSCSGLEELDGVSKCAAVSLSSCTGKGNSEVLEIAAEKVSEEGIELGAVQKENVKIPISGRGTAYFNMAYGPRNLKIPRYVTWIAFKKANVKSEEMLTAQQNRLFEYFGESLVAKK